MIVEAQSIVYQKIKLQIQKLFLGKQSRVGEKQVYIKKDKCVKWCISLFGSVMIPCWSIPSQFPHKFPKQVEQVWMKN